MKEETVSKGIFSTYSQGENRITSSIIQVLQYLPINLAEEILSLLAGEERKRFFHFKNQYAGSESIPDAAIKADYFFLIETKTSAGQINPEQLKKHLKYAEQEKASLVYLTPHPSRPSLLPDTKDRYVHWLNFSALHQKIEEFFSDTSIIISERDQFLLRNLQLLFETSGLLQTSDSVVIVAARKAWPDYQKFGLYVCQAGRFFRQCDYIGFYSDGEIKPSIARILRVYDSINLHEPPEEVKSNKEMHNRICGLLEEQGHDPFTKECQLFLLSLSDSSDTVKLEKAIKNDLKSKMGRSIAFTQGQRYAVLSALRSASRTSELATSNKEYL